MANIDPKTVSDAAIETWRQTAPGGPGYDSARKCYCWGFRPAYKAQPIQIIGLGALGGDKWGFLATQWSICPDNTGACACAAPPPPPKCPTCPKCPKCAAPQPAVHCKTCPVCAAPQPPPAQAAPPMLAPTPVAAPPSKWGVTIGWLVGAAVVGGGGYFMYKKGAFGKGKRR
jgi:hypothetical protein